MKKNLFLVFALLTALYACGVKSASKVSSSDLASGKGLYMDKCGKCHPAFEVKSKSVERWNQVLVPMIKDKAKMNEADGKLVEAYVWNELGVKK
jgi:ribosomal protein L31